MKILIVANHNTGSFSPFVTEQVEGIKQMGTIVDYFGVLGKGISGYLSNIKSLKLKIHDFQPDIIHAHYGFCGLLANLQRKIPVITTYHGSDIHSKGLNLFISRLSMWLSAYNIFVSEELQKQTGFHGKKQVVLPCGIDTTMFYQIERKEARKQLGWDTGSKYILFAGAFDNAVKNSSLAKEASTKLDGVQLIEMRGFNRKQVNLIINAANCLLLTSFREGSPQVIKEAMVCGTPIVTVNVGDVRNVIGEISGCYIAQRDANDIAKKIELALAYENKTNGLERIIKLGLDNKDIAKKIVEIYKLCLK